MNWSCNPSWVSNPRRVNYDKIIAPIAADILSVFSLKTERYCGKREYGIDCFVPRNDSPTPTLRGFAPETLNLLWSNFLSH